MLPSIYVKDHLHLRNGLESGCLLPNKKQLLVPKGFAHGFSVLSETAIVFYKCDSFYNPKNERGIIYDDCELAIDWGLANADILFQKKTGCSPFKKCRNEFFLSCLI